MTLEIPFHFLTLAVETRSPRLEKWLDQIASHCAGWDSFPEKQCRISLQVEEAASPDRIVIPKSPTAVFAGISFLDSHCYFDGERFYAHRDGDFIHTMTYSMADQAMSLNLGGQYLQNMESFTHSFFSMTSRSFVFPFHNLVTLHGAVVAKEDSTFFLAGPAGMGKSTLALRLWEAGYSVLSDDSPLFTWNDGRAYVLPSLDFFRLTEQSLALMPALRPKVLGNQDYAGKYMIPPAEFRRDELLLNKKRSVSHYIQLRRGNIPEPRLIALDKQPVAQALLKERMIVFNGTQFTASRFPFQQYSQTLFQIMMQTVLEADVYALEYADAHLDAIPALLSELAHRTPCVSH